MNAIIVTHSTNRRIAGRMEGIYFEALFQHGEWRFNSELAGWREAVLRKTFGLPL